tara:strand:+ start:1613 stop:1816 length:204 start_codon:yes stop_codon:yes gene_type:complete
MEELEFVLRDIESTITWAEKKACRRDYKTIRTSKHAMKSWVSALKLARRRLIDVEERHPKMGELAEA